MEPLKEITEIYKPPKGGGSTKRRGINSVETGLAVLEAVMYFGGPASLKTIADRVGLDSSQAYRYVSSLINSGMLTQDAATSYYDLGPLALKLGVAAISRIDELAVIGARMRSFSIDEGATCMLSIWGSNGPTIIRWFQGRPPVVTTLAVGSLLPLTSSATGHVFLAYQGESTLEGQLKFEGKKLPLSANADLAKIKQAVLSKRVASIDSKFIPGLRAHAAPVIGIQRTLIGVFTIISHDAASKREFNVLKSKLLDCCHQLSIDIGGSW